MVNEKRKHNNTEDPLTFLGAMATSLTALRRREYYKLIKSPSAHIVQAGVTSLMGISRKSFI
jgi:hypothetical protein